MCQNGWFATRLKYLKQRRNSHQIRNNSNENNNISQSTDATHEVEDMEYLKHVVVDDVSFELIVEKLNSTRKFRQQMLQNKETDMRENFPFFFSHPKLVRYYICDHFFLGGNNHRNNFTFFRISCCQTMHHSTTS